MENPNLIEEIGPELNKELEIFFANSNLNQKQENHLVDFVLRIYKKGQEDLLEKKSYDRS